MSADLHCHTKLSDGSLGIDDLIVLAKKRGVEAIAITDKNCQAGNVRAKIIGERHGVEVLPGVEISSIDPESGNEVDVLCYLADSPDRLEGLCRRNMLAARKASQYMIIGTAKKYPVAPELIARCASGATNIYVQHIMQALSECGFASSVHDNEIFDDLFTKEGKNSVFVQAKYADLKEVIDAIHEAGGLAVIANPGLFPMSDIERYMTMDIDGLEVWSPYNDEEQTATFLKMVKKAKILAIGGTDFRGSYGKYALSIGEFSTPQKNLDEMSTYKARKKRLQKKAENAEAAASEALAATIK